MNPFGDLFPGVNVGGSFASIPSNIGTTFSGGDADWVQGVSADGGDRRAADGLVGYTAQPVSGGVAGNFNGSLGNLNQSGTVEPTNNTGQTTTIDAGTGGVGGGAIDGETS